MQWTMDYEPLTIYAQPFPQRLNTGLKSVYLHLCFLKQKKL